MVKCADCGFLAQHIYRGHIPQGFNYLEENARETGVLPSMFSFSSVRFGEPDLTPEKMSGDIFPTCFSRAFNLKQDVECNNPPDCYLYLVQSPSVEFHGALLNAMKYHLNKDLNAR